MDSRLKKQRQVALIWMNDANIAAAESEPRGILTRLGCREIAEHHLKTYFPSQDTPLPMRRPTLTAASPSVLGSGKTRRI
jgi:hypothetical protein